VAAHDVDAQRLPLRAVAGRRGRGHELLTTGPFRLLRHPICAAQMLIGLGILIGMPLPVTAVGLALNVAGGVVERAPRRA
jgi:protein-S-isoprenylcysteine O-methyltransferase Ste14